jgi:hypothetical protein
VGPPHSRGVVGRLAPPEPAEPAQERLSGRGGPSERHRAWTTAAEVRTHHLGQLVIVEQRVQPAQDGVDARSHLRHAHEEVFLGPSIDQQGLVPLCSWYW